MSDTSVIWELAKGFISRFGYAAIPPTQELNIEKFSDIPDLIKKVRALKYGPKITIAGGDIDAVTTKYMAGYSGRPPYGYSEAIFMEFGNKIPSHQKIREEMIQLKNLKPHDSLICTLQERVIDKCCARSVTQSENLVEYYVGSLLKEVKVTELTCKVRAGEEVQRKVLQKIADSYLNYYEKTTDMEIVKDCIRSLVQAEGNECELKKVIGSRILTIWFIAEAFRYPPMMFYSMLLLHLFVNNELTEEELNEALHPSEGSTEKAQFYCYVRETENFKECTCPHNQKYIRSNESRYGETIDEMEARKTWLLQKLQKSIRKNIDKYGHPEEECVALSATVFKALISKYLTICIGEKTLEDHPVDLDELLKFSLRSGGQLAPIG